MFYFWKLCSHNLILKRVSIKQGLIRLLNKECLKKVQLFVNQINFLETLLSNKAFGSMEIENCNPLYSAIGLGIRIAEKSKLPIHIINESNNELKKHPQILEGTMLPNFNTLFLTTFKFKQSYSLIIICILITVPVITTITLRFSGVIGNILGTGLFSIIFGLFFCGTGLFWKKYKQLCTIQNEEEKNLINAIIGESLGEIFSDLIIFILIAYTSYFLLINLILIPIGILFHL